MLTIEISPKEFWDAEKETFIYSKSYTLNLEHSLISISKWEAKWQKLFLHDPRTPEETLDYIKCMTLNTVPDEAYNMLSRENIETINDYIQSSQSATNISDLAPDPSSRGNGERVSSELIYYWMVALTIPFECQKWHLNRLITLIKICNIKNQPAKKMKRQEILQRNAELNKKRREQLGSKG